MKIPNRDTINRIKNECRGTKRDFYQAMAAWMCECAEQQVTPVQRGAAKMFTLALTYGATPDGPPPWRTHSGALIPLNKMSTAHVQNALAMLERRCADLREELANRITGDARLRANEEGMADWDPRDDFSPGVW
jgi:hypothetical protein